MRSDGRAGRRLRPHEVVDLYRLPDGRLTVLAADRFLVLTGAAAAILELVVERQEVAMRDVSTALGWIDQEESDEAIEDVVHSLVAAGVLVETFAP